MSYFFCSVYFPLVSIKYSTGIRNIPVQNTTCFTHNGNAITYATNLTDIALSLLLPPTLTFLELINIFLRNLVSGNVLNQGNISLFDNCYLFQFLLYLLWT